MSHCDDLDFLTVRTRFASEVRKARKAAGLSQAALAERLGRSQKYISDIELGERSLPLSTMAMILRALDRRLRVEIQISPLRGSKKVAKKS